jgi:hypothetical protein
MAMACVAPAHAAFVCSDGEEERRGRVEERKKGRELEWRKSRKN